MTPAHAGAGRHAADVLPGIPRDAGGPLFQEPWEARALAMTLLLHERGLFSWREWSGALADSIRSAQAAGDPDEGRTCYRHWLVALERLAQEKGLCDASTLARYRRGWLRAAGRTPHGTPIELGPEDLE